MIEEYCDVDDPQMASDLKRIDAILCSSVFLKGLGVNASDAPSPMGFPVVADLVRAKELMRPTNLYHIPEPWPYQEFYTVVEEEWGRMAFCTGLSERSQYMLSQRIMGFSGPLASALQGLVAATLEVNQVHEHFVSRDCSKLSEGELLLSFTSELVPHHIVSLVQYMVRAVYYGGLDNSRINYRVLQAFETGGIPCGWLGPLPGEGGDPVEAIAVMHFGPAASN